ncbi:hypothetical protein GCM10010372_00060 [Streptomyces tauricus]|uniref:Integral membrane protein n=1 Tax=Streptomyces tauricus TaxID=68274 RepID=A0ABZ1JW73_9ACTN|nr:DUF6629 family protein [Streptomyces tauricus]GHA05107.1 hypothetical protein GCM10010372_00060 [Streptomyces tauricus]
MCFSATADLVAGCGIAAVGVACVARTRRVADLPMAALPLILGGHQIVESLVWRSGGGSGPATVAWAAIALPLLAVWVPAGVLCVAPPSAVRRLIVPLVLGVLTAAVLSYRLATHGVTAEIRGHTVGYAVSLPASEVLVAGYLLATIGALLLSGDRILCLLGTLVTVGAATCWALWEAEFVSTWCAFAAVCSLVMYRWVRGRSGSPDVSRVSVAG